jgi:hypothetical protein
MTAASEHEPILRRVHNLPTCQIERTPAAHRPASVQVPSSSLQLSLDIPWHANTRCVNHAPDQKLKSRSLLALDVIRRLTTTVDRGTSFDLQAEVIWRRPLGRSFTRPSARALGVGEPLLSLFEACTSSDDSGHSLKWRSVFESPPPRRGTRHMYNSATGTKCWPSVPQAAS